MPLIPEEQLAPWPVHGEHRRRTRKRAPSTSTIHRRQSDRGSNDDDVGDAAASPKLPVYVRYNDLVDAGIMPNWETLRRAIDKFGFPIGVMLSGNRRAWLLEEVLAWIAARPTAKKDVPRRKHYSRRSKDAEKSLT